MAGEFGVSNREELLRTLGQARGGDTILLDDGAYGELVTRLRPGGALVVAARHPGQAIFTKISLQQSLDVQFRGVTVDGEFRAVSSRRIGAVGVKARQFYFRDVDGLLIDRSEGGGGHFNLVMNSIANFIVRDSYFHGATEDVSRITGNSYNGLVENNRFFDAVSHRPLHADLMQFFGGKGFTPHDIVIRGNHFWDDPATGEIRPQGIFISDPQPGGFRNLLIEENLLAVGHANTIVINGATENVVIRNNSLISVSGVPHPNPIIRISKHSGMGNSGLTVEGNIVGKINDETRSSRIRNNHVYGMKARLATLFSGPGKRWQDFVPVTGSPIDFGSPYGAQARLKDLLDSIKPRNP